MTEVCLLAHPPSRHAFATLGHQFTLDILNGMLLAESIDSTTKQAGRCPGLSQKRCFRIQKSLRSNADMMWNICDSQID